VVTPAPKLVQGCPHPTYDGHLAAPRAKSEFSGTDGPFPSRGRTPGKWIAPVASPGPGGACDPATPDDRKPWE
jgi:hypothetical protein